MAQSVAASGTSGSVTSLTSNSLSSTPSNGSLLVFAVVGNIADNTDPGFITPSGWTVGPTLFSSPRPRAAIFYKIAGSSEPKNVTITWTSAGGATILGPYEFTSVDQTTPLEAAVSEDAFGTSTTPSVTAGAETTQGAELVVAFHGRTSLVTGSSATGSFTLDHDGVNTNPAGTRCGGTFTHKILSANETSTTGITLSSSADWTSLICAFKVATAIGTPTNTVAPAVTGNATVGQFLTTTDGTWTGTAPISFTYQWQTSANGTSGWSNIAAATSNTYLIPSGQLTKYLRCIVTGTNIVTATTANSNVKGPVAAVTVPPQTIPRFGISNGFSILTRSTPDRQFEIDQCVEVGAQVLRVVSDASHQTELGTLIPLISAAGLKVILVLYGTTASISTDTFPTTQANLWANTPAVIGFEICNEPDINGWTVNHYADFVADAYDKINAAQPGRYSVIAGALWKGDRTSPPGPDDTTSLDPQHFTSALCSRAFGKFDYLSLHLYDNPEARAVWNIWDWALNWGGAGWCDNGAHGSNCRDILDAAGLGNVDIISTESGGQIIPQGSYTEAQQAQWVTSALGETDPSSGHIASCFVHTMMNDDVPGYGMLNDDLTPRLSWYAYQAVAGGSEPEPEPASSILPSGYFTMFQLHPASVLGTGQNPDLKVYNREAV